MTINGIISRGQSVCDSANKVYKHLGIVKNIYRGITELFIKVVNLDTGNRDII